MLGRVAKHDGVALAELYAATSAKLMAVVVRILRDAAESEDVLQEVYIAVWRRAGDFDPGRGVSPITWLASIARHRAIDRLRSRGPAGRRADESEAFAVADPSPDAEERVVSAQSSQRLAACLGELEPHVAAAIRTAFFEGLTYDALSLQLGRPPGTVKSWIRRGLLRLKGCLER